MTSFAFTSTHEREFSHKSKNNEGNMTFKNDMMNTSWTLNGKIHRVSELT